MTADGDDFGLLDARSKDAAVRQFLEALRRLAEMQLTHLGDGAEIHIVHAMSTQKENAYKDVTTAATYQIPQM